MLEEVSMLMPYASANKVDLTEDYWLQTSGVCTLSIQHGANNLMMDDLKAAGAYLQEILDIQIIVLALRLNRQYVPLAELAKTTTSAPRWFCFCASSGSLSEGKLFGC